MLRKRDDGFHDLATVFVLIDWSDEVAVEAADGLSFVVDDVHLEAEPDNLCLRAARLLLDEAGRRLGVEISLAKRIPIGAGLGGGSSDAATTLRLLNELWDLDLDATRLRDLGSRLGSDVPVFLHPTPAYATGRGEILSTIRDPSTRELLEIPYWFAVLKPEVHVSTGDAYAVVRPKDENRPDLREVVASLDLDRWQAELVNDFEEPIVTRHPEIRGALALLRDAGADYASLTGSGSAVFGVFEDEHRARAAADEGREEGLETWSGQTL